MQKNLFIRAVVDNWGVPLTSIVPGIDSYVGLGDTLFTLLYGIKRNTYFSMFDIYHAWRQEAEKLENGEISKEEYDAWRYTYPKMKVDLPILF